VLWAVLAIIILRQSLTASASVVGLLIGLYRKRPSIDPITFRDSRLVRQDVPESRDFRVLFEHERRTRLVSELLGGLGYRETGFSSSYRDGALKGVYEFLIELDDGRESFLLNVFAKQSTSLLEHENLLFDYIPRERLDAPAVLAEFPEGPFQCQLLQLGTGGFTASRNWQPLGSELYRSLGRLHLPNTLIEDYLVSHQAIEDRITDELVSRTVVALDTSEQRATFEDFRSRIVEFRALLRRVPLRLQNRDLLPRNVFNRDDDSLIITNWRRWSIDRVGAVTPPNVGDKELAELARELARSEPSMQALDEDSGTDLILLVRDAIALEQSVQTESFNLALRKMRDLVARMDSLQQSTGTVEA
jgi:hypothetical protein